ncbi:hypothetical protein BJ508DRAFT_201478, partial [Ascobolus immersus RN42]
WRDFKPFPCPTNIKNDCPPEQQNGFDWADLNPGRFNKYKDFNFDGWTCGTIKGKRDEVEKRSFNSKCITAKVTKQPSNEIKCDKNFSIGHIDVSADEEVDVEILYGMPDGSTCKQRTSCNKNGKTIKNTQCGGAKS